VYFCGSSACISPASCLDITVSLVFRCIPVSSHFAADPLYPAAFHCNCIHLYLYPCVSSYIQLHLYLLSAVSRMYLIVRWPWYNKYKVRSWEAIWGFELRTGLFGRTCLAGRRIKIKWVYLHIPDSNPRHTAYPFLVCTTDNCANCPEPG